MIASVHSNDIELFQLLVQGSEEAFRVIFHRYFSSITGYTFKITHTKHEAEEIAQEVFLRLWQKRHEFTETTELKSWLYRVASNLAFDHLKKQAHHGKLVKFYKTKAPEAEDMTSLMDFKESKAKIDEVVRQLPEQQQTIFKLSRDEGLSHQEIAERLHISPNTVKNHMVKALQTLRSALNRAAQILFSIFF
jgi:RNA polymerase sigma-70 factor (family 1)